MVKIMGGVCVFTRAWLAVVRRRLVIRGRLVIGRRLVVVRRLVVRRRRRLVCWWISIAWLSIARLVVHWSGVARLGVVGLLWVVLLRLHVVARGRLLRVVAALLRVVWMRSARDKP